MKINFRNISVLILAIGLLSSCEGEKALNSPNVLLNGIPETEVLDGTRVFGKNLTLIDPTNDQSLSYAVGYDSQTGITTISKDGIVVHEGKVQRIGKSLMIAQEMDGMYSPTMIRVTNGEVVGFDPGATSLKLLELSKNPDYSDDVTTKDGKVIWNVRSKQQMAELASSVLESAGTAYKMAGKENSVSNLVSDMTPENIAALQAMASEQKKKQPSLEPNPASESITIHMPKEGSYKARIISIKGEVLKEVSILKGDFNIDITDLTIGKYLVSVSDANNKQVLNEGLVVKR